jgi:carbonic anhydrase
MRLIVEENVRLQLEHLREFPFIKRATKEKKLNVHGWVYDMSTGEIKPVQNA